MNKAINILILISICIAGSSCVKEKLEEIYSRQETNIDNYLSRNNTAKRDSTITYIDEETGETISRDTTWTDTLRIVYNGGSARLVKKEGSGEELSASGAVSFYYAGYVFNNGVNNANLFATNHQQTAERAGFDLTDPNYELFEADMSTTDFVEGLRNGLIGVRAGEECEIVFSAKYGFGKKTFGIIDVNSPLLYKIWVVGVSND